MKKAFWYFIFWAIMISASIGSMPVVIPLTVIFTIKDAIVMRDITYLWHSPMDLFVTTKEKMWEYWVEVRDDIREEFEA